jgi:calcium-dependent protein kinase
VTGVNGEIDQSNFVIVALEKDQNVQSHSGVMLTFIYELVEQDRWRNSMVIDDGTGRRLLQDEYNVGQVLGKGGFSVVRHGVSKDDGMEVAIKTLKKQSQGFGGGARGFGGGGAPTPPKAPTLYHAKPPHPTAPKELSISEALLANEIVVMRRIVEEVSPHPNVIHLLDVFDDPASVHLILECCSGGELFDRIVTQERYSEAGAAKVIHQIADGLYSLHTVSS